MHSGAAAVKHPWAGASPGIAGQMHKQQGHTYLGPLYQEVVAVLMLGVHFPTTGAHKASSVVQQLEVMVTSDV